MLPGPGEQIAAFVLDITERKLAENALRESERKLREVQEMAHLGSWHWDVKTGHVEWSAEVYKIFRLDPEEFTPQIDSILALSPWPEDHQRNKELINRAMVTHEPGFYEQKFLRPDQSIGQYYSTFRGNYDAHGELVSIVGTVMDITERKRAEEALHESVAKLQLTIDEAPVCVVTVGLDKRFLKCNKSFCTFLGYSDEELKEKTVAEITFPGDVETSISEMRTILAGEKKESKIEKRYVRKDGAVVWGEVNINIIRNHQGNPIYFLSIIQDITERRRAEEVLRENEVQYRNLADTGLALIWKSGTDKLCTYFNEPWLKFTGRTLGEELGNGWTEGVHPGDFDRCVRIYVTAFDKRESFDMNYRLRHAGGEYRWIRDLGTPNYNSSGEFVGYIGHCFDITEQRKAEFQKEAALEEIRKLNEELEQRVVRRTAELTAKTAELERINKVFVDRELRMRELKARIAELEGKD
jgi:PAS domain S-box-containing protein